MREETLFFQSFTHARERRKYLNLLKTRQGRDEVLGMLNHFRDLDLRVCRRIKPAEQTVTDILRILTDLGAPSGCYVISSNANLDGRRTSLRLALEEIVGSGKGAVISAIPGELTYYEGVDCGERYLCHRAR